MKWRFDPASLVFFQWCLQREAPRWRPPLIRLTFFLPAIAAWLSAAMIWPEFKFTSAGSAAISNLLAVASFVIVVAGFQFAARSICWEVSTEMRDLVRLTGVGATTLLWSKTVARWWTIGWSLLLILPLAMFAKTMGGVTSGQLISGACGLALVVVLTGASAMLAGVLAAESKNPEKTATGTAVVLLAFYNLSFVFLSLAILTSEVVFGRSTSAATEKLASYIMSCTPVVVVFRTFQSTGTDAITDPAYWGHFLVAIGTAYFATQVLKVRFRSSPTGSLSESDAGLSSLDLPSRRVQVAKRVKPSASAEASPKPQEESPAPKRQPVSNGRRPRCSGHPFFWKDVFILSDERGRVNPWTVAYFLFAFAIIGLLVVLSKNNGDPGLRTVIAFVSIAGAAVVVSLRFDALLTVEFRERTWGSLMLLPIDPCDFLWFKLQAAIWEQRFAVIPIVVAQLGLLIYADENIPGAVMSALIAVPACLLLCQMSTLAQLLGKVWWLGPCQAIGFIAVTAGTIAIWIGCGLWLGFVIAEVFLVAVVSILHKTSIQPAARQWIETE
ncbi:MAG: hypothetical protein WCJ09_10265 [Planctomycetota bacterium]